MRRGLRHYARDFFTNWSEYEASFTTKLRLTLRNRMLSTGRLRECCGNHGEPGC